MNEEKSFKVIPILEEGNVMWDIIRIGHKTRRDYLMARFYDRGAVKLFIDSLANKGFKQICE